MRYVSIDIETTGLDPDQCQVLEFGAVLDNGGEIEDLPTFSRVIYRRQVVGEPFALGMNAELVKLIAVEGGEREKASWGEEKAPPATAFCMEHSLGVEFSTWLQVHGMEGYRGKVRVNVAGKNFAGFDLRFLRRIESWEKCIRVNHRTIDASVLYWQPGDKELPSLGTCLKRAGLVDVVTHRAVDDAKAVVRLLRGKGIIGC